MTRDFDYITLVSMRQTWVLLITLFGLISLTSCSSATRKYTHHAPLLPGMTDKPEPSVREGTEEDDKEETEITDKIVNLDEEVKVAVDEAEDENDIDLEPKPQAKKHQIPFEFNQKVADWIRYFSQNDRERFQRFFDRGEPYREVIENILEENHVPVDLYYLGMIESGFSTHASSHAKAVGVWQFMRATGKSYGLAVDSYVDERRDPIRATEAAAKMLRDLHREFKSWYLAMAAYNAGSGRIRGAIRRGNTNDFWELVEKKKLPKETMEYVPKFLAARYIGENPDIFAFYINEEKKYPNVELAKVPPSVPFESIEKTCSIPTGTLAFLNPQYLKNYTHPGSKYDEIWVPEALHAKVEAKHNELQKLAIRVKPERSVVRVHSASRVPLYVVKHGDSLKTIAVKRGLSVAYLKRVNGLKSTKVVAGQRLKLSASSYQQKNTHPRRQKKKRSKR